MKEHSIDVSYFHVFGLPGKVGVVTGKGYESLGNECWDDQGSQVKLMESLAERIKSL